MQQQQHMEPAVTQRMRRYLHHTAFKPVSLFRMKFAHCFWARRCFGPERHLATHFWHSFAFSAIGFIPAINYSTCMVKNLFHQTNQIGFSFAASLNWGSIDHQQVNSFTAKARSQL
jgi:glycopeptide antibiotics resistance protein